MIKKLLYGVFTALNLLMPIHVFSTENDAFTKSQEFYDIVNYDFAVLIYDHFYNFVTDEFKNDQNSYGYKIYPRLGKNIIGKVGKVNDGYVVEFKDDLPLELQYVRIVYDVNNKKYYITNESLNGKQSSSLGDFEFKIPENFIEIASKFGSNADRDIARLKISLTRMVRSSKNIPNGIYHFYVKPFNDYTGMGNMRIYWVERKATITFFPGLIKDLSELTFNDFRFSDFKFDESCGAPVTDEKERLGHEILTRYDYSNAWIANCVRDGKVIVVEKK